MKNFKGVVSSATPEASAAGAEILMEGGNAVDAAVAVSLVLGVTEPAGSGIGAQSSFIIQSPHHVPFVINGTSFSPASTPVDIPLSDLSQHKASTVPSNLKTLEFVWKNYGSGKISWKRVVEPATGYAKNGYHLGEFRYKALLRYQNRLCMNKTAKELFLNPDGSVPKVGSIIRNPILSETLERLGNRGVDDFYSGEIAQEIASDMKNNDGWITLKDLQEVKPPRILPALISTYRGWDVASLPPPASGWAVLMALNILEHATEKDIKSDGPKRIMWMVEALRTVQRHRIFGPIQDLSFYDDMVNKKISKKKAEKIVGALERTGLGETTHFSIVDDQNLAVGITQSLNSYYGAKVVNPKLGFLYNDYMLGFVEGSRNNPYALRPHAMPYSSMSATILSKNCEPALVLGSPAHDRIISAVIQVISHWVDLGKGIKEAVIAPRIHTGGDEEIMIEKQLKDLEILLSLEKRGYTLYQPLSSLFTYNYNPYFGGVHAVAKEKGVWIGAADPRRDGKVVCP